MLTLERKIGDSVKIGEDITIFVASIKGDKVRLSFDAPDDIPVHRQEVFDRIVAKGGDLNEHLMAKASAAVEPRAAG